MVFTAQAAVPFVDDWFRSSILVYSKNGALAFDRRQVRYHTQVKVQRESNKGLPADKARGVCLVVSLSLNFTTRQIPHTLRLRRRYPAQPYVLQAS